MSQSIGIATAVVALLQAGCQSSTTTHDGGANAVIRGSVADATGTLLPGVLIESTGHRYECAASLMEGTLTDGQTASGPDGSFNLSLQAVLAGPGEYCVDLIATPQAGSPDTLRGIAVRFFEGEALDTSQILLSLD